MVASNESKEAEFAARRNQLPEASNNTEEQDQSPADDMVAVVRLARNGDRGAQRELYERCHRNVYRLMVRMVGEQDAADVTQQAFLQMFRKLDQFTGRARFQTWLYRLAVNESLQHLRRARRWRIQEIKNEPADRTRGYESRSENRELLDKALQQLDPDLKSVFLLREVEELSYREIASVLEVPEGTVGSRLNRARQELQRHLTNLGWEP